MSARANAFLSLAEDSFKWNKSTLKVCWASFTDLKQSPQFDEVNDLITKCESMNAKPVFINEEDRAAVKETVIREYNLRKTGITFEGWQNCTAVADADIKLVFLDKIIFPQLDPSKSNSIRREILTDFYSLPVGQSNLGLSRRENNGARVTRSRDEKGFIFVRKTRNLRSELKINPQHSFLLTVLHEFGHAAGLRHEHIKKTALTDPNCKDVFLDKNDFTENTSTAHSFGEYDPLSIMNYCNIRQLEKKGIQSLSEIQLSPGDLHTLRCLYQPETQSPSVCLKKAVN